MTDDASVSDLIAQHYRWWTCRAWHSSAFDSGVKVGPLTAFWYRWLDGRVRVSRTWRGGAERLVWGGPLSPHRVSAELYGRVAVSPEPPPSLAPDTAEGPSAGSAEGSGGPVRGLGAGMGSGTPTPDARTTRFWNGLGMEPPG